ncbi:hypothetical protein [Mycobacterium sp. 852002-51057_SCH5723018]|uniref:hypothetical protein n=1 Tax=Mycobacterium sp. 852002-51057_SCH5723018 TaxID=1834094 RepID=UPI000800FCF2|nr:hypothetical protein [Mycobacterium sp. 852002-51057_SCH5723018]OBG20579.1 hypothetical protein A5764_01480 [Mycobacterium sp. 852002-51057_SCH5723018]
MNLQLLTDEDVAGLTSWCEPFARMDHPAVSDWGNRAWRCCVDEARRRIDGGQVTDWPAPDSLPTEALVLIGQLLAGVHDAGSEYLAVWVEEFGETLVDLLLARANPGV